MEGPMPMEPRRLHIADRGWRPGSTAWRWGIVHDDVDDCAVLIYGHNLRACKFNRRVFIGNKRAVEHNTIIIFDKVDTMGTPGRILACTSR